MTFKTLTIVGFKGFLILSLFVLHSALHAADSPTDSESVNESATMGRVEYELPDDLGTLTFSVPEHWVGARAKDVEAAWIDQDGSPFKDNVVLKIRPVKKVDDGEQLLDYYIDRLIEATKGKQVSTVSKETKGRRSITFEIVISDLEVTQTSLVLYTESSEKSYLLTMTSSHLTESKPLDLSPAKIQ